jgi:hypothetical protein
MKKFLALFSLLLVISCAGKEEAEVAPQVVDSVIKPQTPVATGDAIEVDSNSGILIDRSRMRSPEHLKTLERFEPKQVMSIYHDFSPLRKEHLKQATLDSFLTANKITLKELHAILSEGDQLGWNSVDNKMKNAK